jgi:multidrug efflux system membrane fusion protein
VVDAQNKVQYRRVTPGSLQDNGLRVIEEGLQAGDGVVVGGLQQVRPRMEIQPDLIPMPAVAGTQPPNRENKAQPPPPGENNGQKASTTKEWARGMAGTLLRLQDTGEF